MGYITCARAPHARACGRSGRRAQGVDEMPDSGEERLLLPPTCLTCTARYEKVMDAFGGKAYFVDHPSTLAATLRIALADKVPSLVNVMITPFGQRKPQEHDWLTRAKL